MRLPITAAAVLACFGLVACTSSSGIDGLGLSSETTSSIQRPNAPVVESMTPPAAIPGKPDPVSAEAPQERSEPPAELAALVAPERPGAAEAAYANIVINERRFRDAKPINFGKASPKQLAVHGVDVSRWQGDIDWQKLRGQGANFAYIKATDGGDHLDPMFTKNWRDADKAGLKRGAYHFFYWCRTAGEQADWFIRNVPKVEGALPPVIDVEWNGESSCKRRPRATRCWRRCRSSWTSWKRHYGQRPIIYTAPDFYATICKGAFPNHPFWLRAVAQHPSKVYPGRKWVFWQYSGSGLSHGVEGRIDLNVFHGGENAWRRWLGRTAG